MTFYQKLLSSFLNPKILAYIKTLSLCIPVILSSISLWLSYTTYINNNKIIIKADFKNDIFIPEIKLSPTNENIVLMKGEIYFPKKILDSPSFIKYDGYITTMGTVQNNLKEYVYNKFKNDISPKYYGVMDNVFLPIVIISHYVSDNSELYTNTSLYYLEFSFVISHSHITSLNYEGLLFIKNFDLDDIKKYIKYINEAWEGKESMFIPFKNPSLL